MLFDWFTIGAQVINFVVLIWLMKHFLYQPILKAIDARESLIVKELADAKMTKAGAKKEQEKFSQKNQEYDQKSVSLLAQATETANAAGQKLMEDAKKAAAAWSA